MGLHGDRGVFVCGCIERIGDTTMIEYKVISTYKVDTINKEINEIRSDGWRLLGPVTMAIGLSEIGYPKTRYIATMFKGSY